MDRDTRVPPHSVEAEQAVLGAVLRDNEALVKVQAVVEPEHFYKDGHRLIFATMQEMASRGEPIDLLTLQETLRGKGELESIGGASYLWGLLDATPTAANVLHYVKFIMEKAMLRGVRGAVLETLDLIEEGHGSADEIMARSNVLLSQTTKAWTPESSDGLRPAWESVPEVCRFLDDGIQGFSTGFPVLDDKLMGLRGLVLLGAAPGVGKSTFCLNVGIHVAIDIEGASVLYCDIENGRNIVMLRMLSNLCGQTIEQLRGQRKSEWETWQADLEEKLPGFYLTTDHALMRPEIIERQIQQIGADKTLVVLDSLQKLPSLEKQRRDSIDAWLRALERIKQDPSIVILLVSELSRGEHGVNYKKPSLNAFKESGDIEYSADVALQFTEAKVPGLVALHCVKNRLGKGGHMANYSYEQFKYWRWVEVPR